MRGFSVYPPNQVIVRNAFCGFQVIHQSVSSMVERYPNSPSKQEEASPSGNVRYGKSIELLKIFSTGFAKGRYLRTAVIGAQCSERRLSAQKHTGSALLRLTLGSKKDSHWSTNVVALDLAIVDKPTLACRAALGV